MRKLLVLVSLFTMGSYCSDNSSVTNPSYTASYSITDIYCYMCAAKATKVVMVEEQIFACCDKHYNQDDQIVQHRSSCQSAHRRFHD